MAFRSRAMRLSGWGGYPAENCELYRPEALEELGQVVREAPCPHLISRGMGRSYGDSSLNQNSGVVLHERMNRFLSFDPDAAILHCESAVTLSEIIDAFLPRGFFLPITPGTKRISVGGAIAADVHGKNHHRDGTISTQVVDFRLLTGSGEILECSRTENSEIYWATLGGMGLTGAILDARLQLKRVDTGYVTLSTRRCRNLDETLEQVMEYDRDYAYAVAWLDCLAQGQSMGRSVLLRANPAAVSDLPESLKDHPFESPKMRSLSVPFRMPGSLVNGWSMRLFNSAYYLGHRDGKALSHYQKYFYPLDAIENWNRLYGRRGVLQYQLVLPWESSRSGLIEIMERVTGWGGASFLTVLKSTGPANRGPLSFPIEGMSLALDFPNRGRVLLELLSELDEIVIGHGGRIYLAKDSTLSPDRFQQMYPRLGEFLAVKRRVDPEGRFSSSLARRLQILE